MALGWAAGGHLGKTDVCIYSVVVTGALYLCMYAEDLCR